MEINRRKAQNGARFLSFQLDGEVYCMDILKAKELMGMVEITPLPQTPPYVRGVINLRGRVIPVVDLRIKFGLCVKEDSKSTSIIVADVEFQGAPLLMGVVVDAVREVVNIPDEAVSRIPYINAKVKAEYIRGIANLADGMLIILDVVHVLNDDDYVLLRTAGESSGEVA